MQSTEIYSAKTASKCCSADNVRPLIGNTPMLEIGFLYKGEPRRIYTKIESFNMTGSIKDRMALYIIEQSYANGSLKKNDTIIEATSGNTGISFAAIGKALGHKVKIFMPDWMSMERINLIKRFGSEIHLVSHEEGGFLGSIEKANQLAATNEEMFLPRQFDNSYNCQAHFMSTGPEICRQLTLLDLEPDAFVAGVGTGGTVMGVGRYMKEHNPSVTIHALEPENSPTLTTGCKVGKHRIQGISDEFIPSILDLDSMDSIVMVDDGDAIIMAQKLSSELGLGVGISSGANFIGALKLQNELGTDKIVTTVFPDSNKKYLSTDLMKKEGLKDGFLSPDVELHNFNAVR
jgi:cysteine synthase A